MMTALFRVVLILVSLFTCWSVSIRVRKSKMSIETSVYWILLSLMFVIFALFPVVPDTLAHLLGIYSTANFLFLFMIFLLLLRVFHLSMQLGSTEEKLKTLVQELALEKRREQEAREKTEYEEGEDA